jgi:hypothetical protein
MSDWLIRPAPNSFLNGSDRAIVSGQGDARRGLWAATHRDPPDDHVGERASHSRAQYNLLIPGRYVTGYVRRVDRAARPGAWSTERPRFLVGTSWSSAKGIQARLYGTNKKRRPSCDVLAVGAGLITGWAHNASIVDTQNSADFAAGPPNPRNRAVRADPLWRGEFLCVMWWS